jgi:uncharacterized protein YdiU (UPF0061 family)
MRMMSDKLGIENTGDEMFKLFLDRCPELLQMVETDMTIWFRKLADLTPDSSLGDEQLVAPLLSAYYEPDEFTPEYLKQTADWLRNLIQRWNKSAISTQTRVERMNANNPRYVLRNYLAQLAIDKAEKDDYSLVHELQVVLTKPYDEQPGKEIYAEKRPDWARHRAGCSMLSCSS